MSRAIRLSPSGLPTTTSGVLSQDKGWRFSVRRFACWHGRHRAADAGPSGPGAVGGAADKGPTTIKGPGGKPTFGGRPGDWQALGKEAGGKGLSGLSRDIA